MLNQWQKDLGFWVFCVLYLGLFRLYLISAFRYSGPGPTRWEDIWHVLYFGFRFDTMVAAYWVTIPFLFSFTCGFIDIEKVSDKVRSSFASVFIVASTVLFVVTQEYFSEFGDQFNHFLFGLYYDDRSAIMTTIWKDYDVPANLFVMAVLITVLLRLKKFFFRKLPLLRTQGHFRTSASVFIGVVAFLALFLSSRGALGTRPVQLKDAASTKDPLLNKMVMNPFISLKYAIKKHQILTSSDGLEVFLPDGDIREAAGRYLEAKGKSGDLDALMETVATGNSQDPPRNIFLIVMESYDTWPMLEKYSSLGLTGRLKSLASKGIYFRNFLPAGNDTMASFMAIVTGLPYSGVATNYHASSASPYPTAVAETFRKMGYKTRFFYGGKLSWQRVGDFCLSQGFDEVFGAPHMVGSNNKMGNYENGDYENEWGVDDKALFDFVERKTDPEGRSFNLILTTSYHPPYDIPFSRLKEMGFTLEDVPEDLKPMFDPDSTDLEKLAHLWYADRVMGEFVEDMEEKGGRALFAITGDHYGRNFINQRPSFFESSSVPFVLYGKGLPSEFNADKAPGSHLDISSTLVGLAAPEGFHYYSLGKDLLGPNSPEYGIGRQKVIGEDFIADLSVNPSLHPVGSTGQEELADGLPDIKDLKLRHNELHGIGWWRVMNGSALPPDTGPLNALSKEDRSSS